MGKGRKEKKETLLLNLSMDSQCVIMNAKDKMQLSEIIDIQDDLRRKEFRKNIQEKILDIFEALEYEDCSQAKKKLIKLESFLKSEFEKEDYYEQLDDENRINTTEYLKDSTEKIREINYQVECELIKKMKDILSDREVYKILEQYEKDLDTMETVTIVLGYDDGQTYYTKGFSFMYDDGIEIDLDTLDINVNFDGFAEHEVINPSGEASLYFNNITGKFECSEFSFYDIFLSRQQFEYWWTKKQVTKIQGWISDYEEKIDKLLNKYDERYGHIEKF